MKWLRFVFVELLCCICMVLYSYGVVELWSCIVVDVYSCGVVEMYMCGFVL